MTAPRHIEMITPGDTVYVHTHSLRRDVRDRSALAVRKHAVVYDMADMFLKNMTGNIVSLHMTADEQLLADIRPAQRTTLIEHIREGEIRPTLYIEDYIPEGDLTDNELSTLYPHHIVGHIALVDAERYGYFGELQHHTTAPTVFS